MLLFAFPGTGKTSLAAKFPEVLDLELSEIKYDNSSVSHLSKEERKSLKRPLKTRRYREVYVHQALSYHREGRVVLVALNFLLPLLWCLLWEADGRFHIVLPAHGLREAYRKRYLERGNNTRFIGQVMAIWSPTLLVLPLVARCLGWPLTILKQEETLETVYGQILLAWAVRKSGQTT